MNKQAELDKIASEIKAFKGLEIARKATKAVPGEGDPNAKLMFIGEAPGFNEDREGRPFVGQAGKLLEKTLNGIGLQRSEVYITNIVKFRPPDNRDPFPEEIEACKDWLDRQIAVIEPKIIVTLGRFSMAKFIPGVTISRIHGIARNVDFQISNFKFQIVVFPMYHPAAALRATSMMNEFISDFNKLNTLINPPVPEPVKEVFTKEVSQSVQQSLFDG
jgi:uracil-DNA glycosylase